MRVAAAVRAAWRIAVLMPCAAAGALAQGTQSGAQPLAIDSIARLPGRRVELDTTPMISAARIASLPREQRVAWEAYIARSRRLAAADRAAMRKELDAVDRRTMQRAPWARDFHVTPEMTPGWFRSDSGRQLVASILSYQAPNGGWSKHVDFAAGPRAPGQSYFSETDDWRYIATIDNASTVEELRFLALAEAANPDPRHRESFVRGLRWLLDAQMPNGCWPQVFPLQGGYHDAATFNDDAIVGVARLLREVGAGTVPLVGRELGDSARSAVDRAVACMLDAQVVVNGRRTIWGQQHDPLTLAPTSARSYELTSLTADESAGVATFLMSLPAPSSRVVRAVHAAADWFRANRIDGLEYASYTLTRRPGAGPLWGRMVEIGTGRAIFSNRDGVKLYDYDQLTDRRSGYRWFTAAPSAFLAAYERWARSHPRPRP